MKIMLSGGDSVVIETHNGERIVISADYDLTEREFLAEPSVEEFVAATYISIRLEALQGRIPYSETIAFPNNHVVGRMRSIGSLKDYD